LFLGGFPIDSDALPTDLPYSRRDLADRIAACIQEKFNQLTHNDVRLQRRKVLAGVVLTHNFDLDSMEAISVTTGTKCIGGDRLTLNGQSLDDCHAEIIARRSLIRYCYQQLKLLIEENNQESIFERIQDTNRFRLKPSIAFHLYISTSPCGDGRLFAPQEAGAEQSSSTANQDPNNKQMGYMILFLII
jgi:double stranded RNA-specific editase B